MISAVWRTCQNQEIRRFRIEDSTGFSAPDSGRGTVQSHLCVLRLNAMEDYVPRQTRGSLHPSQGALVVERTDKGNGSRALTRSRFFLLGPTCPWSTGPYQESHVSHAVTLPGSSSYSTHLDEIVSGTDRGFLQVRRRIQTTVFYCKEANNAAMEPVPRQCTVLV